MRCKIWFTLILLQSGGENPQYSSSCHLQIRKSIHCLFSPKNAVAVGADAVKELSSSTFRNVCMWHSCTHMSTPWGQACVCAHAQWNEWYLQWVTISGRCWYSSAHLSWVIYKLSLMCKFRTLYHADNLGENYKLWVIALLNHYLGLCHCIHSVLGHLGQSTRRAIQVQAKFKQN